MKKAIITQMLIFIIAWASMTPDVAEDNSYIFGLIGGVEIVRGNTIWVMLIAMFTSVINLWFWWPKEVKVTSTSETPVESTKSAITGEEVKAEETKDPVVPKMD